MTSLAQFTFLRDLLKIVMMGKRAGDRDKDASPVVLSTVKKPSLPPIPDLRDMVQRGCPGPLFVHLEGARRRGPWDVCKILTDQTAGNL